MFLRNYCLRPSCYECHAKYLKKADMTIGDFWGINCVAPEMNDGMGTSLVITRTNKGDVLFEKLKGNLIYKEVCYEEGVRIIPSEHSSIRRSKERESFFDDLSSIPFEDMENKYAADIKVTVKQKIKNCMKRVFRVVFNM